MEKLRRVPLHREWSEILEDNFQFGALPQGNNLDTIRQPDGLRSQLQSFPTKGKNYLFFLIIHTTYEESSTETSIFNNEQLAEKHASRLVYFDTPK